MREDCQNLPQRVNSLPVALHSLIKMAVQNKRGVNTLYSPKIIKELLIHPHKAEINQVTIQ